MEAKIYDNNNHIFSICSLAQEDNTTEHAFLFSGTMEENNRELKVFLKERVLLDAYAVSANGEHISFQPQLLHAALKVMKRLTKY